MVAAVPDFIDSIRPLLRKGDEVVAGGATRRASVAAALRLVEADIVVVHDAVRPLLSPAMVHAVIEALDDADGAILATPVADTVKRVSEGTVVGTMSREELWLAQTPQAFRADALRRAHAEVPAEHPAPDDASLVEAIGGRIVVVPWVATNIKVTRAEDLDIVERLLSEGGEAR